MSSGRHFCTKCDDRKRKLCAAANSILSGHFSQECTMYLLETQCLPILMYGTGV